MPSGIPITTAEERAAQVARVRAYRREWNQRNRDKVRERQRRWREQNREKIASSAKARYQKRKAEGRLPPVHPKKPQYNRRYNLQQRFGLALEQYEQMEARQHRVCAICASRPAGRRLAVDHCHDTGRVRGLLCTRCNTALGLLNDDPQLLLEAIRYLRRALLPARWPTRPAGAVPAEPPVGVAGGGS